ncbi:MAG: hypothetical protein ABIS36_02095 [Chryseolinea sp.]
MSPQLRQYAFAAIFLFIGIYQLIKRDSLEAVLYIMAAVAFITNSMATEPRLITWKKPLVVVTWVLIVTVGVLFLYLLQFKYL